MSACIEIFHNCFIVIGVDEKTTSVSRCGIDKSVKFIQQLEFGFGGNTFLLDRINISYRQASLNGKVGEVKLFRVIFLNLKIYPRFRKDRRG
jgi:hypothetical protein